MVVGAHTGFIVVEGKTYYQEDGFIVETYPEPEDRKLEALNLCLNARDVIFGLAEDSIGIPPKIFRTDRAGYITSRREQVETILQGRKALYESDKGNRLSAAKYVGAMIEMIGVLAEEMIEFFYPVPNETEEQRTARDAKIMGRAQELLKYYRETSDLINNVQLKGGKYDIDGVLRAQLGETWKASCQDNEVVHKADYGKIIGAMREIYAVADWMDGIVPNKQEFLGLKEHLMDYKLKVIHRLSIRREDLLPDGSGFPRRDRAEVEIEALRENIRSETLKAANQRAARHIRRGTDLMYTMIKQGEKPVSVWLLFAIREAQQISYMMKALSMDPVFNSLREQVNKLAISANDNIKKAFYNGSYSHDDMAKFTEDLYHLEQFLDQVQFPTHLRTAEIEKSTQMKATLKAGFTLLQEIMPDLSPQGKIQGWVTAAMMDHVRLERANCSRKVSEWLITASNFQNKEIV